MADGIMSLFRSKPKQQAKPQPKYKHVWDVQRSARKIELLTTDGEFLHRLMGEVEDFGTVLQLMNAQGIILYVSEFYDFDEVLNYMHQLAGVY